VIKIKLSFPLTNTIISPYKGARYLFARIACPDNPRNNQLNKYEV